MSKETGKTRADLRDQRRHAELLEGRRRAVHRRHGPAALRLERNSAGRGIPRHPRHRVADRADRQADPAFARGGEHGQSARDVLGRRRRTPTISASIGPLLENHPIFPERANITLAHIVSREHIVIRTWERGAGLTRACGSAACAAAVAAARLKRTDRKVKVTLPGGELTIDWRERDDHVLMTGPVAFEFAGTFDPASVRPKAGAP